MKTSKVFVSILSVVFAVLSLIIVQSAVADEVQGFVTILDNATGGDCPTVGKWNATTKTCKLTKDIDLSVSGGNGIIIEGDGITLLCNGHSITGDGSNGSTGIEVPGMSFVTIKYCNVQNFDTGIFLNNSSYSTVSYNTANSNSRVGIYLVQSNSNTVNNNTANSNFLVGIQLTISSSNAVNNNTTDSNLFIGLELLSSDSNTMNNNTTDSNLVGGINLTGSGSNTMNNNTANSNGDFGIAVDAFSHSNTVNNNTADDNSFVGYFDNAGTGTDNTYNHDECSGNGTGSDPSGLCSPQ